MPPLISLSRALGSAQPVRQTVSVHSEVKMGLCMVSDDSAVLEEL